MASGHYWRGGIILLLLVLPTLQVTSQERNEVPLSDFQEMDKIAQRNWLYRSLDEAGFAQSPEKMQKALYYMNKLDWESIDSKDLALADKFVQKVPMDDPQGKYVANKYFGKVSGEKLSIQTGQGLQWNGEVLKTRNGATINPQKIPERVAYVDEINGNLIFQYEPLEEGSEPAKVTLQKGELVIGGMNDELTQPSPDAQFTIEGGDANLGGVQYHPDNGIIEARGDDNFKITDHNLQDEDPASILIFGANRGLKSDIEVSARQKETFVGRNTQLFDQFSNSIRIDEPELYAKGDLDMALSPFGKDENFAEYTFKNGILDTEGRKVTPEQTNSEISLHYNRNGEHVVWDVDGDDFETAPTGMSTSPQPGKPKAAEVRTEDEELPEEAPDAPLKKLGNGERPKQSLEKKREETTTIEEEEREEGTTKEKTSTTAPEKTSGGASPSKERVKENVAEHTPTEYFETAESKLLKSIAQVSAGKLILNKDDATKAGLKDQIRTTPSEDFSYDLWVLRRSAGEEQIKSDFEKNYNTLSPQLKPVADELRKTYGIQIQQWLGGGNIGLGSNKYQMRIIGDKVILEQYGGKSFLILPRKYSRVIPLLIKNTK